MPSWLLCSPLLLKIALLREGLGITTNNAAEYRALILGLDYAAKKGFKHIRAQGDSKLVCNQVKLFFLCYFVFDNEPSADNECCAVHSDYLNSTNTKFVEGWEIKLIFSFVLCLPHGL
jgi:ribonuclease HI